MFGRVAIIAMSLFPLFVIAQSPPSAAAMHSYCERLEGNETVKRYALVAKQYIALANEREIQFQGLVFDTPDDLVATWVRARQRELVHPPEMKLNGKQGDEDANRVKHEAIQAINACAYRLRNSDLLVFFDPQSEMQRWLKHNLDLVGTKAACADRVCPGPNRIRSGGGSRTVDASGNVTSTQSGLDADTNAIRLVPEDYYRNPNWAALHLFVFPGGEKLLETVGKEVIAKGEQWVGTRAAMVRANEESRKAAEVEDAKRQKVEEARKVVASKAASQAAQNTAAAQQSQFAEIRSGNWKIAHACVDIASAFDAVGDFDESFAAALQPNNKMKGVQGPLQSFTENRLLGTGNGLIGFGRTSLQFTTSRATRWFNKDAVHIGDRVMVVGRYVDNRLLQLTSGERVQIAIIDAACIEK